MSLKAFHIVFIIFSKLLALGTGVWCLWVNLVEGAPIYVAGAVASFVVAIVLMAYGVWFYRKMKRLRSSHEKSRLVIVGVPCVCHAASVGVSVLLRRQGRQ